MDENTQQLERYYAEIGPALLAYFRRGLASEHAADDLLQETFLRAWRQRGTMRQVASPRAYLFGIARHVRLDALRRERVVEPLVVDPPAEASQPVDERIELIRAAIVELPEIHRETLRLKLEDELSYVEIAEVLDVPVGTVRSRLHHAVEQLQRVLNPNSAGPARQNTISHEP